VLCGLHKAPSLCVFSRELCLDVVALQTCFNRLDLPNYSTKDELEAGLKVILAMDTTGFTMD